MAGSSCFTRVSASIVTWPLPCVSVSSYWSWLSWTPITGFKDNVDSLLNPAHSLYWVIKIVMYTHYCGLWLPLKGLLTYIYIYSPYIYIYVSWIHKKFTLRKRMKSKADICFLILMFGFFSFPALHLPTMENNSPNHSGSLPHIPFPHKNLLFFCFVLFCRRETVLFNLIT